VYIVMAGDDGKNKEIARGGACQDGNGALAWLQDRNIVRSHALKKVMTVGIAETQDAGAWPWQNRHARHQRRITGLVNRGECGNAKCIGHFVLPMNHL
jgi:hypothetical protein